MKKIRITNKAVSKFQNGYKLVQADDFLYEDAQDGLLEGSEVALISESKKIVAKFVVGRQNKGLGWVFTTYSEEEWDYPLVYSILEDAIESRKNLLHDDDTTAFRLLNGEGDGLGGVTMDYYANYIQINWYSKGVYQYREWYIEALVQLLPQIKGIYETIRFQGIGEHAKVILTYGEPAPQPIIIKENGVQFAIHLGEEWMMGLFLDQREVRQFVRNQASELSVLNLFSYTGGFSVAAACGGARQTVSVDIANRSLAKTVENFELNHVSAPSTEHEIRVMDVFDYIQYATRHAKQFDMVVCDPPSFANTKQYQFRAEKDYVKLANDLFDIVAPGGLIILSTNHSGYYYHKFKQELVEAGKAHHGHYQLIQSFALGEDYPTTKDQTSQYLKVLVFYRTT